MQKEHKDIFYFFSLIIKWKKVIIINVIVVTIAAIIISFLLPPWFMARTTLLPPQNNESSLMGAASNILKNLPIGNPLGGLDNQTGTYDYFAILRSRTAMEKVINKFDLFNVYQISDTLLDDAVKELQSNTNFYLGEDNYIGIEVYDKDPQRAADMANYFVQILNEISLELSTQEARNNRVFIEKRYNQNIADLKNTEDSLYNFQKKYGIVAVPEQIEASVKAAAEIEAELIAKEILAQIAETQLGKDSPQYSSIISEVNLLKNKVKELKYDKKLSSPSNILYPFSELPQISVKYLRYYRELEVQQTIMQVILPLYEQSKVEEQKQIPVILVLDKAIAPNKKAKPKKALIIIAASALSFLLSSVFVIGVESFRDFKERLN